MGSGIIIDVSEMDFEYEVVEYSKNHPVVVDFWADWCQPCKVLGPSLEKITSEAGGAFRLARVNTDANPNLALRFNVRSLPTVKVFSQGQVASEFVGLLPDGRLRDFLGKITPPSPFGLAMERAESLLLTHEWTAAENQFRAILQLSPESTEASLGLVMALLGLGQGDQAMRLLKQFPASREFPRAELMRPYTEALIEFQHRKFVAELDLDPAFENSIRLAARGNLPAALDGLLDILRTDKHYRQDRARLVMLGLLELMGTADPQTRQYRSELASVLF